MNRTIGAGLTGRMTELSAPGEQAPPLRIDLAIPLVLDLDGTLFATDTLLESLILFLRSHGWEAWRIPGWVLSGRAVVKERLAAAVGISEIRDKVQKVESADSGASSVG